MVEPHSALGECILGLSIFDEAYAAWDSSRAVATGRSDSWRAHRRRHPVPAPARGPAHRPAPRTFHAIDLGVNHACGVQAYGTIKFWGPNDSGAASPPGGGIMLRHPWD